MSENSSRFSLSPSWRSLITVSLVILTGVLTVFALLIPSLNEEGALNLEVGDVSSQDIRAPTAVNYQSQVLTEERQESIVNAVSPVYDPPDSNIARSQVERLRNVMTFITNVRANSYASPEQQLADLAALQDIQLSQETAQSILGLNDARWQVVQQETILVLEQVLRITIRDTQLEDARRQVPALVSLAIPVDQAGIVAELVSGFVTPNSLYNEELTEIAREQARESVEPVNRSFAAGETILNQGQVITAAHLEALERFGLLQTTTRWQDWVSTVALVIVLLALSVLFLRSQPKLLRDLRNMAVVAVVFLLFLYAGRLIIPGRTVIPFLYPIPAFSLLIAVLFGNRYGLILSIPLSILVAYDLPNGLGLTLYYMLSSMFGVFLLGQARRVTNFIWSGVGISITAAVIVIAYMLPNPTMDLVGIATLTGAALFTGVASASLAVLFQFFLAQILGLTTSLQLMEISRSDHPLLQYILRNAPGTYQHSLQVANLAEQAAEFIGADSLLARVGALYHDAGKAINPYFFIENQPSGFKNPHDDLDPYASSEIIIRHVTDGLEIAKKYRLPPRIHDFILEHHGTLLTSYQYAKAIEAEDGDTSLVDAKRFRYPGPAPQSRETALVLMADGCEARVRAKPPKTVEELREVIKEIIDSRMSEGQLDDTRITTRDLRMILDTFTSALKGVYHPRIQYPKTDLRTLPSTTPKESVETVPGDGLPQADTSSTLP